MSAPVNLAGLFWGALLIGLSGLLTWAGLRSFRLRGSAGAELALGLIGRLLIVGLALGFLLMGLLTLFFASSPLLSI